MHLLTGQRVYVDWPSGNVVGVCAIIDAGADFASVVTKYEARGDRRFVKGVPYASLRVLEAPAPYGTYGDGVDQRAHEAIERLAGRMVKHSKDVRSPMGSEEAYQRARTVAGRNH